MSSEIQAAYGLTTDGWTPTGLLRWLKNHDMQPIKRLHRNGTELRYRIRSPHLYARFRTKILPNGVHLVLGFRR